MANDHGYRPQIGSDATAELADGSDDEPVGVTRGPLPAALPRKIIEHAGPRDGDGGCPACGGVLRHLGANETEVLDYVLGGFHAVRHVRPKLTADFRFDPIERGDPLRRGFRQRRFRRLEHVEEFPPRVRHAGGLDDSVAIQTREAGVAIRLQDAFESTQMLAGMLALAIGRIAIEHAGRRRSAERPVIADIGPEPAGLRPAEAGRAHRNHGVIGVGPLAAQHVSAQRVDQGTQQRRRLSHHVGERRAADVDVGAGVLFRLTMQRVVITELRRRDMGEQASTGAATPDRQFRHRRLDDRLAAPARTAVRLRVRTERSAPLFADLKAWLEATLIRVSGRSEMAKAIR